MGWDCMCCVICSGKSRVGNGPRSCGNTAPGPTTELAKESVVFMSDGYDVPCQSDAAALALYPQDLIQVGDWMGNEKSFQMKVIVRTRKIELI